MSTSTKIKSGKALLLLLQEPDKFREHLDTFENLNRDFYLEYRDSFLETLDEVRTLLLPDNEEKLVERFFTLPFPFQEAICEYAMEKENAEIIGKLLSDCKEKKLKKLLKNMVHRLKTKGIVVKAKPKKSVLKPIVDKLEPIAYASTLDAAGESIAWIAIPSPTSGYRVLEAFVSKKFGILRHQFFETSKSDFRKTINHFQEKDILPVVQADPAFAVYALSKIVAHVKNNQMTLPEGFLVAWNMVIAKVPIPEVHPAWQIENAKDLSLKTELVNRGMELHDSREFKHWVMDQETMLRFNMTLQSRQSSTLVINEQQSQDYIQHLVNTTVEEYFNPETRQQYAEMLLDMAYLFNLMKKKDFVSLCLASSRAFADTNVPLLTIPFAGHMLTKLIRKPDDEKASVGESASTDKKTSSGLILP